MTKLENDPMDFLEGPTAVKNVRTYFGAKATGGRFTGRAFHSIGSERLQPGVFTGDDIVAVSLLSVAIPPEAAITLLDTKRLALSELLHEIPDENLWEVDGNVIAKGSHAETLWTTLAAVKGIGWVTAHKLCARKRPNLLPVYDRVVKAALQPHRKDFWQPLRETLRAHDKIVPRLQEIKRLAQIPNEVPLLRVLDVAVWMTSQGSR
jgi:hypothetical protein